MQKLRTIIYTAAAGLTLAGGTLAPAAASAAPRPPAPPQRITVVADHEARGRVLDATAYGQVTAQPLFRNDPSESFRLVRGYDGRALVQYTGPGRYHGWYVASSARGGSHLVRTQVQATHFTPQRQLGGYQALAIVTRQGRGIRVDLLTAERSGRVAPAPPAGLFRTPAPSQQWAQAVPGLR